ncbi:MAG: hypothetical protein J6Y48_08530 [Clostridia bacterium]|nr:hypothetical protein [Clostridia bacterium]
MRSKHYSIFDREKIVAFIVILAVIFAIGIAIGATVCHGEEPLATCYAMCKPGSRISVRMEPRKTAIETGFLECGDSFQTDGESVDGWIRCIGIGEGGWVYSGYVVTEKPQKIGEKYECTANKQVACRKWMSGPQIEERPWMKRGQICEVFVMADGWAVTSRGYIKSEYLERYWEDE